MIRQREMPSDPEAAKIVRALNTIVEVTGQKIDDVFEDWLAVCDAFLTALPRHTASVAKIGLPADDTDDAKAVWARLRQKYRRAEVETFNAFRAGLHRLIESAYFPDGSPDYQDRLGQIYEAWGYPSHSLGQYFTPWDAAALMARLTMPDGEAEIYRRLQAAYEQSPEGQMHAVLGEEARQRIPQFVRDMGPKLLPACWRYFEPVTVYEPCVGSGVMFLAMASQFPVWSIRMGLVRFYGQDLDPVCVRMARINCMLYGLNTYALQCYLALSQSEVAVLPVPQRTAIEAAREASEAGDPVWVAEIRQELAARFSTQLSLFGAP